MQHAGTEGGDGVDGTQTAIEHYRKSMQVYKTANFKYRSMAFPCMAQQNRCNSMQRRIDAMQVQLLVDEKFCTAKRLLRFQAKKKQLGDQQQHLKVLQRRALEAKTAMRAAFEDVQDAFKQWLRAYVAASPENMDKERLGILSSQNLTMQEMQLWAIALMDISVTPRTERQYTKNKTPAAITQDKLYLPRCTSPHFAPSALASILL